MATLQPDEDARSMTPADKDKLRQAFSTAIEKSPWANETVDGMTKDDNTPMTRRELVAGMLKEDSFYAEVDKLVAGGKVTLDAYIANGVASMQKSLHKPAKAPAP